MTRITSLRKPPKLLATVLGGTALAFGQALLFLLLAPLIGIRPPLAGLALALLFMAILSFALTSLGFCIAWRMTSTQGFHAVMNLFLMPLWFLSGALFPAEGAMGGLRWVMRANPLSYGLDGLRQALYWHTPGAGESLASFGFCLAVSVTFAAGMFLLAIRIAALPSAGSFE